VLIAAAAKFTAWASNETSNQPQAAVSVVPTIEDRPRIKMPIPKRVSIPMLPAAGQPVGMPIQASLIARTVKVFPLCRGWSGGRRNSMPLDDVRSGEHVEEIQRSPEKHHCTLQTRDSPTWSSNRSSGKGQFALAVQSGAGAWLGHSKMTVSDLLKAKPEVMLA
jgi:hypothetical protein